LSVFNSAIFVSQSKLNIDKTFANIFHNNNEYSFTKADIFFLQGILVMQIIDCCLG